METQEFWENVAEQYRVYRRFNDVRKIALPPPPPPPQPTPDNPLTTSFIKLKKETP